MPHDNDCFKDLECRLRDAGLVEDARWLRQARTNAYTASSELLGETGAMVARIYRSIPVAERESLRADFEKCERAVQLAWPKFNLNVSARK
jgi:hypothetical protein